MAIRDAMQKAATRLVSQRPQVFFGASDEFELELVDLVNEVATDICKYHDWQALVKINAIQGDGVTDEFPLPVDYDRQLLYTVLQDLDHWLWGYTHVSDINTFLSMKYLTFGTNPGLWTMFDNKIHFIPAPQDQNNATFPYISLNYAIDESGQTKKEFTADADEFVIRGGERLLTLGLIWRWRENKKLDYTGDQENFELALNQLAARDKGSNVYRQYSASNFRGVARSYPYKLGV